MDVEDVVRIVTTAAEPDDCTDNTQTNHHTVELHTHTHTHVQTHSF